MSPVRPSADSLLIDALRERLEAEARAGAAWRDVGAGPEVCLSHERLYRDACPDCGAEAIDAAAQLEHRFKQHGGALLDSLEEAIDLLKSHRPARLEQLERWVVLVRRVRGF